MSSKPRTTEPEQNQTKEPLVFAATKAPKTKAPKAGGKLLELPAKAQPEPEQRPKRDQPVLKPDKDTLAAIESRGGIIAGLAHFMQADAWGMVGSWPEAFAVGRKNVLFHLKEWGSDPDQARKFVKDKLDDGWIKDMYLKGFDGDEDELYFDDRCAQIYAEETKDVDRLAAEARERVAQRIESEFGQAVSAKVAKYLRDDDPQGYCDDFDWN